MRYAHYGTLLVVFCFLADPVSGAANDVTNHLEFLGNPAASHYPSDAEWRYARNPWDLQVFDGKLYIGTGNSSNAKPASNAASATGPIPIFVFNPDTDEFFIEGHVSDEQIEIFRVIDHDLYIPGHDPARGRSEHAAFYRRHGGRWDYVSTGIPSIHNYDIAKDGDRWWVAKDQLAYSDDGMSWSDHGFVHLPLGRVYRLFKLNGKLLASGYITAFNNVSLEGFVRLDGKNYTFLNSNIFFPIFPTISANQYLFYSIRREVNFENHLIYIGGTSYNDHQWLPFALYTASSEHDARMIELSDGREPWDIIVKNGACYVLTSIPVDVTSEPRAYIVSILRSVDLNSWDEVLRFSADTYARSFEMIDDDFYVALGSNTDYLPESTGNIYRITSESYE